MTGSELIDICYTCGKELDWNEVLVYWSNIKTPTGPLDGQLKAFCNESCASKIGEFCPTKIGEFCPIKKQPEQLVLDV